MTEAGQGRVFPEKDPDSGVAAEMYSVEGTRSREYSSQS